MKIKNCKLPIPEGADVAALNRKISAWADRRGFGIAHSIRDGVVNVEFYIELNGVVVDPVLVEKALQNLVRIINRSSQAPQAEKVARRNGDAALRIPDDTARLNWLEARNAGLNRPNSLGGLAHVWVADGGDCPTHHYDETYRAAIDRAMGYASDNQPMGSTPATRRSKRSA